jgi:putative Mg2+ transporter-C (MgtC) family protein
MDFFTDFNMDVDLEIGFRLLISFLLGAAIGLEREYNSKAAGLRTMIMICLGSTIFTELSIFLGADTPDRIASNIVTGVGFLGAGVIFKDGLNVSGITTATTIWIAAALGMAVGAGEYFVAIVSTGVIIIVLSVFNKAQRLVEKWHQIRTYKISLGNLIDTEIENDLTKFPLRFAKKRSLKENGKLMLVYEVTGSEKELEKLTQYLQANERIIAFEY